ncbi:molybdopterin-dependent oxidoreductase [Oleidesulfovibrio sp.]|uniref:molybdopterin-dependent oxidoreductase n=1 Tax=Oleidesulfovibrio sp. TaxID=2909707 RepID=UPI003A862EC4
MNQQISACTLDCPDCCSLITQHNEDGTLTIKGNPAHPFTNGIICNKGRTFAKRLHSEERITTPLIRKNGQLQPATWDEALTLCAEKINALRNTPERMLHIRGAGTRGVLYDSAGEVPARLRMATTYGSLCDETGIEACKADFGDLTMSAPSDLANASRIVNWGRDVSRSSIHLAQILKDARKAGTKVLLISPCPAGADSFADAVITIRPGTDRFLAAAAAKRLLKFPEAQQILQNHTTGSQSYLASLARRSEAELLSACDASVQDLDLLVEWYSKDSKPVASLLGWGLQRYLYGAESVRHINALALISGNIGRKGAGTYYNISSSRNFNRSWMKELPPPPRQFSLPRIGQELTHAAPPVELIWCRGINFVNQCPDSSTIARTLEKTFLVVTDAFMTDTARQADVFLPCTLMLEREEILGSFLHNYVHYSAKVIQPPESVKDDFDILQELGNRLCPSIALPDKEACLRRGLESPLLATTLEELKSTGFTLAKHPEIAFEGMVFAHADGKFCCINRLSPPEEFSGDYPLSLLTLVRKKSLHSQIPTAEQSGLPELTVSPLLPANSNFAEGETARLCTPRGEMRVVIRHDNTMHPTVACLRRGGWVSCGWGANSIIEPLLTDAGEGTAFYSQKAVLKKM